MEIIVSKVFSFYSKDRCKSLFTGKQRNTNTAFRQKEKKKKNISLICYFLQEAEI